MVERDGSQQLNVVFNADSGYLPHLATALQSLFYFNSTLVRNVFVVSSDISADQQIRVTTGLEENQRSRTNFLSVSPSLIEEFHASHQVSQTSYLRFFLPEILPNEITTVLYLDCDLVVLNDLRPLVDLLGALDDATLAWAAEESDGNHLRKFGFSSDRYFNAGVMLINLAKWRKHSVTSQLVEMALKLNTKALWWDQDSLNLVLENKWRVLPPDYNFTGKFPAEIIRIAHFAGSRKPWMYGCDHPLAKEYFRFRKMTGFPPTQRTQLVRYLWESLVPRKFRKKMKKIGKRLFQ